MPACEDIREEFSALLDEELDPETRDTIEAHLCACSECLRELHTLKRASDLYRAQPRVRAPRDFESQVMQALQPRLTRHVLLRRLAEHRPMLAVAAGALLMAGIGGLFLQYASAPQFAAETRMAKAEQAALPALERSMAASQPTEEAELPQAQVMADQAAPESAPEELSQMSALSDLEARPEAAEELGADGDMSARAFAAPADSAPEPLQVPPASISAEADTEASGRTRQEGYAAKAEASNDLASVGERRFRRVEGVWQENEYRGQDTTPLEIPSAEFKELLRTEPLLEKIAALGPVVVTNVGGKWYRLRQREAASPFAP